MLKIADVAEKYQVSEPTIYRWMKEGMPKYKLGGSTRFDENEVDHWVKNVKGVRNEPTV